MTERAADRLAREKHERAQSAAQHAADAESRAAAASFDGAERRFRAAVPLALKALEDAGHPDVELVELSVNRLVGRGRSTISVGGWLIAHQHRDGLSRDQFYLLSDGRLRVDQAGRPDTVDQFIRYVRDPELRKQRHNSNFMLPGYRAHNLPVLVEAFEGPVLPKLSQPAS